MWPDKQLRLIVVFLTAFILAAAVGCAPHEVSSAPESGKLQKEKNLINVSQLILDMENSTRLPPFKYLSHKDYRVRRMTALHIGSLAEKLTEISNKTCEYTKCFVKTIAHRQTFKG